MSAKGVIAKESDISGIRAAYVDAQNNIGWRRLIHRSTLSASVVPLCRRISTALRVRSLLRLSVRYLLSSSRNRSSSRWSHDWSWFMLNAERTAERGLQ